MKLPAQITQRTLLPSFTVDMFVDKLITSFIDSELNIFSRYSYQGKTYLVYKLDEFNDNNLCLAISFYAISITQIGIEWSILNDFDIVTHLSSNQVTFSATIVNSLYLRYYSLNHPEIKGVILCQENNATFVPLVYVKPLNKAIWWNDRLIPWIFIFDASFSNLKSLPSQAVYANNNNYSFPSFSTLGRDNVFDISPDGILILSNTGQGCVGSFANLHHTSFNAANIFFQAMIDNNNVAWIIIYKGITIPCTQIEVKD